MPDDLVTWLRAQLDDDERVIERNSGRKGITDDGSFPDYRTYDGEDLDAADAYLAGFNPKRMRAEVDAKRRILDEHDIQHPGTEFQYCQVCHDYSSHDAASAPCTTLRILALPYADRPGYRPEWKPED